MREERGEGGVMKGRRERAIKGRKEGVKEKRVARVTRMKDDVVIDGILRREKEERADVL